jgi:energy-coupling factor transport system ATP-binding protein
MLHRARGLSVAPKNFKTPQAEYEAAIEDVVARMNLKSILDVNPLSLDYTTKKIVTIAVFWFLIPGCSYWMSRPAGWTRRGHHAQRNHRTVHKAGHTVINDQPRYD